MLEKLIGAYRLTEELGSGGMGKVYLARVEQPRPGLVTGQQVALKILHPHLVTDPGLSERFRREAEIGKRVAHENVVRTHDLDVIPVGDDSLLHVLVMEYVEGQTLRGLQNDLDRVPEELCCHIAHEVANGLAAIHEVGVVHRDLKPENVLITRDHVVKVMDLGVARITDALTRLSEAGAFLGSVHYAAPEQFRTSEGEVDGRADLYALGRILYELATGEVLYRGEDVAGVIRHVLMEEPRAAGLVNPQLSPFFEEVVHHLLEKDCAARFGTAESLLEVLIEREKSTWWRERAATIRAETRKPLRRIRVSRETELRGRDGEIDLLCRRFEEVRAGECRVVLVEGEAGIGKTRLVDDFLLGLEDAGEDIHYLGGSYPPAGAATAAGAFSAAFREHFGEESLETSLARYLTVSPALAPAFGALLRGGAAPEGTQSLDKDSIQAAFLQVTRALAGERPTIVLIEDLHFAPDEGRALFAALAFALPGHRVMLIGTTRHGLPESWLSEIDRREHVSRLALGRLERTEVDRLLRDTFKTNHLSNTLGDRIARKSDGNPFIFFEIIRSLRDQDLVTRSESGEWITTSQIRDIELPSSVVDLIRVRLEALDEREREHLEVAACCGHEFDPTLVAEALGENRIPVFRAFAHLERTHRLVQAAGRNFVFDHHEIQRALHDGLPDGLREEYHSVLGAALERRLEEGEPTPGELALDLTRHLLRGGREGDASKHVSAALDHLTACHLIGPCASLAGEALSVPGMLSGKARAEVLLTRAAARELLGLLEEEASDIEEAMLLAEQAGDDRLGLVSRYRMVGNLTARGLLDRAQEVCDEALLRARELGDPLEESRALQYQGNILADLGRFEEALAQFQRNLTVVRDAGDKKGSAQTIGNMALISWQMGRQEEARKRFEECLALFREIGHRRGEGAAHGNLGLVYHALSRHEEAREQFERHLEISREIGYRRGEAMAFGNLGMVCQALGLYAEARDYVDRDLAASREIGNRRHEAIALANRGVLLFRLGDLDEAGEALRASLESYRESGIRWGESTVLKPLAELDLGAGRVEEAEAKVREGIAIESGIQGSGGAPGLHILLGRIHRERGRNEAAREEFRTALHLAQEAELPDDEVISACEAALVSGGDAGLALELWQHRGPGLDPADKMHARWLLFRITGERTHLEAAHEILERLRANAPEEHQETMIENHPLHRDIAAAWEAGAP